MVISVRSICGVVLFCSFVGAQFTDDKCTHKTSGKPGTCTPLTKCPAALDSLKKGVFPDTCGFEGQQPIVCCVDVGPVITRPTRPSTTTAPKVTTRIPGEISRKKCKEYNQYVINTYRPPVLISDPEDVEENECGFLHLPLVVGGEEATRQEFPHMALVGYQPNSEILWRCGGSIISENYILTAGHCLSNRELGNATHVKLGITDIEDNSNHMQEIRVRNIVRHPEYRPPSHYNDIGLLVLERKARLDGYARPACLYTSDFISKERAIASGWGKIDFAGDTSKKLLKVVLEFFDVPSCNHSYRSDYGKRKLLNGIREDIMICAGSKTEVKDTCQGDSGGPLQIYHDDSDGIKCMYDIVGVVSFGKSCGISQVPGVYTKVSQYIKWIEDTVWPA